MELNQEKIEAAIVREAAEKIISNDDLYERIKRDVDVRIDRLFASRVEEHVSSAVEKIIRDGFEHQYQKRDSFGKPLGEPTTISAELEKLIGGYWNVRVGRDGKPTDSSYGSVSRAEFLMAQLCVDDFQKEVKQYAINATGQLKDALRSELKGATDRMLSELFHVSSLGDQTLGQPGRACIDPKAASVAVKT